MATQHHPVQGAQPAIFGGSHLLWPNGWMDQNATCYKDRPRPRPHCVIWGSSTTKRGTALSFGPCLLWPTGRPYQLLLSTSYTAYPFIKPNKSSAVGLSWDGRPWPQQTWAEKMGGCCAPFTLQLGLRLTQCSMGRGLLPYQVASSSIQQFCHNRHEPKTGDCTPFRGSCDCM